MDSGKSETRSACPSCGRSINLSPGMDSCPFCRSRLGNTDTSGERMGADKLDVPSSDFKPPFSLDPDLSPPIRESERATGYEGSGRPGVSLSDNIFHGSTVNIGAAERLTGSETQPSLLPPSNPELGISGCNPLLRWDSVGSPNDQSGSTVFNDIVANRSSFSVVNIQGASEIEYEIYRKDEAETEFVRLGSTKELKWEDKKAGCGVSYSYKVRAIDGARSSAFTDELSVKTEHWRMKPPLLFEVEGGVRISAVKSRDESVLVVERKYAGEDQFREIGRSTEATLVDKNVDEWRSCEYRVFCTCGPAKGVPSETCRYSLVDVLKDLKNPDPGFGIKVWAEKQVYSLGERARLCFRADEDCYVWLVDIGPTGSVTILFPNHWSKNNHATAGRTYHFPEDGQNFEFKVIEPTGLERIKAVATKNSLDLADMKQLSQSRPFFQEKETARVTRGLALQAETLSSSAWSTADCEFEVIR